MTRPNDDMLDDLFAQARTRQAAPDDDLIARIHADADAVQDALAAPAMTPPAAGLWTRLMDAVGGWPAVGGLAAATVAGIWVGVAPPASVSDMTASIWGDAVSVPLVPGDLGLDAGDFADG